jgi:small subunit ribosomal protein S1
MGCLLTHFVASLPCRQVDFDPMSETHPSDLIKNLREGQIVEGVVKRIKPYGAFVDLGCLDGLLHITDMSYKRLKHPSELIKIGDTVRVKILRIDHELLRLSLGMKQMDSDPWESASVKYPIGAKLRGMVTDITKYGAFVELELGIEGLMHVSNMSRMGKNSHPSEIVSRRQNVEVIVLQVDSDKRRISLSLGGGS